VRLPNFLLLATLGLLLASIQPAPAQKADTKADPKAAQKADSKADQKTATALHTLFEKYWQFYLEQFPVAASYLGDQRYADRWDRISQADSAARREKYHTFLKELTEIDREKLAPGDQLHFDLFDKEITQSIEESLLGLDCLQITPLGGLQSDDEIAAALPFATVADYEAWIARLRAYDTRAATVTALLREGIERNILLPRIVLQRVPPQIDAQIVASPQESPFYRPFKNYPANIAPIDQARLAGAAEDAIQEVVIPAFKKFKTFFEKEYLPACPEKVGFGALKNGPELYAWLIRRETTTDLTADKIHELGLGEVARIRAVMETVKTKAGFEGSLEDFFKKLRTDPQFYPKTGSEVLLAYQAQGKRIDPLMVRLFHQLPRIPYGIEAIPARLAPDQPTAYYRPPAADGSRAGTFFVNTHLPETRPTWERIPLALHEAVPGHHLQIALAMEQDDLPKFRRYGGYTAFVEGWGVYAETLGYDLQLYNDPFDQMGQLTYEMWRALRLVIDTGLHSKGWDRQKAIDIFKANTPKSEAEIAVEVDRYLVWPAQALSYKIGQLKITQLRQEAGLALGNQFDLRDYHDLLMKQGGLPLDIMEREVKAWTAAKARAANISLIPR